MLHVGSNTAGNITVTTAVAASGAGTLELETGGGVTETASPTHGTITVANLSIQAVNAVAAGIPVRVVDVAVADETPGARWAYKVRRASGRIDVEDSRLLYDAIEAMLAQPEFASLQGGMGFYPGTTSHPPFVHVDVRGFKARWRG